MGRVALHTHISTQNNPYLNEICPENVLWINSQRAASLGIKDGDILDISSTAGSGNIKAHVTDLIHPQAVFMLHGFGHQARTASRSFNKGLADGLIQENVSDMIGGSPALHHTIVNLKAA